MTDEPRLAPPTDNGLDDEIGDDDLIISSLEPEEDAPRQRIPLASLRPLRRVWRASGVVALVALLAMVFGAVAPHLPRLTPARTIPQYIQLGVSSDLARCLIGASWSRNGQQIAAVRSNACSAPYLDRGVPAPNLLIFDASTGRQVAGFNLDDSVTAALAQVGLQQTADLYSINYFGADWSPDNHRLVTQFGVYGDNVAEIGAAVVTLAGPMRGHISVMVVDPNSDVSAPTNGFDLTPVDRWDVVSGAHTVIFLPPALAYRWLPSDVLVADQPLPTNANAPAPAESATPPASATPDASVFTVWRNGDLSLVNATACGGAGGVEPLSAPYSYLRLDTPTWSPDGRYLLDVAIQARLPNLTAHPATKTATSGTGVTFLNPCNSGLAPDQLPNAPLRDNGLRSALGLLDPQGNNDLSLAWSPDRTRLAVATMTFSQRFGAVVVYDCASGSVVQRFTGDQFEAIPSAADVAQSPIWSPDSAHLLLTIDGPMAKLVILGPESLAA